SVNRQLIPLGCAEPKRNPAFHSVPSFGTLKSCIGLFSLVPLGLNQPTVLGLFTVERKLSLSQPWKAPLSSPNHQSSYDHLGMNFSASAIVLEVPSRMLAMVVMFIRL